MTHLEPEDILRQALHAAAESVEPAADGLARIRARLSTPHPLAVAWLVTGWASLMIRSEPLLTSLAEWLAPARDAAARWLGPVAERAQPLVAWAGSAARRAAPAFARVRPAAERLARMVKPSSRTGSDSQPSRYAWLRPMAAMGVVVLVAIVGGFVLSGLPHQISQVAESILPSQTHKSGTGGHNSGVTGSGQPIPSPSTGHSRHGSSPSPSPACSPSPSP